MPLAAGSPRLSVKSQRKRPRSVIAKSPLLILRKAVVKTAQWMTAGPGALMSTTTGDPSLEGLG